MSRITVTMKMEKDLHAFLKEFCDDKGLIIGSFVEKAVKEKLEKEELTEDLQAIVGFENDKNKIMFDEKTMKKRLGLK